MSDPAAKKPDAEPNLAQQIEAVMLAMRQVMKSPMPMREAERDELKRRLAAAAETLKTLEFGRAVLR